MSVRNDQTKAAPLGKSGIGLGLRHLTRLLLAGALLLGGGCRERMPKGATPTLQRVKVATAEPLTTLQREFVGLSTPDDAVNLAFKIGGQVLDIPVSKGRSVVRGELIAELDPREVELQVEANRTAYEEASSQLGRMKRLLAREAISVQEYEMALTRHAQARSNYQNSLALLKDTKIRAPFGGVIEATYVDAFQRVGSGEPIARLVNPLTRTVSFTAPEGTLQLLDLGSTRFSVRFDNYRGVSFAARLKNHAKTSTDGSGFPTSLTLLDPDTVRYPIAPGMSCTISMELADPDKGAVAVPLSAIYAPPSGGSWVWVVGANHRVALRKVKLGNPFGSDKIAINEGLKRGERVVTAGVYKLHEGEQVELMNDKTEEPR